MATVDWRLTVEEFAARYVEPAMREMADQIGADVGDADTWVSSFWTPEERARMDAENEARAAYYAAPGYFWLGAYADEDHKLWPFGED